MQRLLLGRPLPTTAAAEERLSRPTAIGAFGLDALSSVAHAPDEILYVLLLAGPAAARLDLPIAVAITALLLIVTISYRQTIYAYPHGGGSFTVARESLGRIPGLVAAAALMVDYLTVVAVSITVGVQAIIAFWPALEAHRVAASVAGIVLLMVINLRGVREAGAVFAIPTYAFIGSLAALIAWGVIRVDLLGSVPQQAHAAPPAAVEGLSLVLVLHAFAGGCTAMTGVEAIANGVPAFKPPESRNAAAALSLLAISLGVLFLGITYLGHRVGAVPTEQANVIAQVGRTVADGPLFYLVQLSAAVVLLLAANTSFNGFPLLAATMARAGYFPHQSPPAGSGSPTPTGSWSSGCSPPCWWSRSGQHPRPHPAARRRRVLVLHPVPGRHGPPLAAGPRPTLAPEAGRQRHRRAGHRARHRGGDHRQVLPGAWLVVLLVPFLVLNFRAIHAHYQRAREELAPIGPPPSSHDMHHRALVPVHQLNRATAETIRYALSASESVTAVHVAVDSDEAKQLGHAWQEWCRVVPCGSCRRPIVR